MCAFRFKGAREHAVRRQAYERSGKTAGRSSLSRVTTRTKPLHKTHSTSSSPRALLVAHQELVAKSRLARSDELDALLRARVGQGSPPVGLVAPARLLVAPAVLVPQSRPTRHLAEGRARRWAAVVLEQETQHFELRVRRKRAQEPRDVPDVQVGGQVDPLEGGREGGCAEGHARQDGRVLAVGARELDRLEAAARAHETRQRGVVPPCAAEGANTSRLQNAVTSGTRSSVRDAGQSSDRRDACELPSARTTAAATDDVCALRCVSQFERLSASSRKLGGASPSSSIIGWSVRARSRCQRGWEGAPELGGCGWSGGCNVVFGAWRRRRDASWTAD